jgi:hypothetical protein
MTDIVERMRAHITNRGGLSRDADGNPVAPNGAWAMMLEAADEIERIRQNLEQEKNISRGDWSTQRECDALTVSLHGTRDRLKQAETLLKARACRTDCNECDGDHDITWCGADFRAYFEKHKEPA